MKKRPGMAHFLKRSLINVGKTYRYTLLLSYARNLWSYVSTKLIKIPFLLRRYLCVESTDSSLVGGDQNIKLNCYLRLKLNLQAAENGKLHCLPIANVPCHPIVKVETEETFPCTPESLLTPRSDVDDDSDTGSFVSADTELRSPVEFRFQGPAEVNKVLQQQERNRDTAAERIQRPVASEIPRSEVLKSSRDQNYKTDFAITQLLPRF